MIKFGFEGPDGIWRYAIKQYDASEESSVWHVRAVHYTDKSDTPLIEFLKSYGIYEGYFEIAGPEAPSTLTLVTEACKVVGDEVNQT